MTILLIATSNPGKREEMFAILKSLGFQAANSPGAVSGDAWQVVDAGSLGIRLDVPEDGETYAQNAAAKAAAYCHAGGYITLADDSGLEVDALDGAPGVSSARYAPTPGATDADRRTLLLSRLAGEPRPWHARFQCALAIAVPRRGGSALPGLAMEAGLSPGEPSALERVEMFHFHGTCEGEIIPQERGSHGFGYDPIFFLPTQGKTMAELETHEKNRISHRGLALLAAKPCLDELLRRG